MAAPIGRGAAGLFASSTGAANGLSPEAVRAQLARVLQSSGFSHAPRRQQFLTFVVEETLAGRGDTLKEFVVAAEVFGRRDTYDPTVDATVRVEARRVREHLDGYYARKGAADAVRIVLPIGTYTPRWHARETKAAVAVGTEGPTPTALLVGQAPSPQAGARRLTPRLGSWSWQFVGLAGALAAVALGATLWLGRTGPQNVPALVVLPFAAPDVDAPSAYLANGLFEDLTSELARARGLAVLGRRSAGELRRRGLTPVEIGRELNTPFVLDGTVHRVDGRVRVTARLIDAASGRQTWAETYERPWQDMLGLQRDLASAVTQALAGELGAPEVAPTGRQTTDALAWDAYLEGRYLRDQRTQDGLRASVPLFERAVALDPGYASAWAALGEALTTLAFHGLVPKGATVPRARAALDRAASLSPELAQAHAARAWLALVHDWHWRDAEQGFRRALTLDPTLAQARQMYAFGLATRRRFDEALAESQKAMAMDPRAYAASTDLAVLLFYARRYDESLHRAREALRLDPHNAVAHVVVGSALLGLGRADGAIHEFELGGNSAAFSHVLGRLGYAFAISGRPADAREALRRIDAAVGDSSTANVERAYVYAGLGDRAAALAALRRAVDARDGEVIFLDVQPFFDGLRGDPEFNALRARVGLDRD
jgi:TolB-like protein/Tfp pilus assembly protein PilF